jgi:hypothetical protein
MIVISANRTIVLTPSWQPPLTWPTAEPDDSLDYSLDVTAAIEDATDAITVATAMVAPSGTGEVVASNITVANNVISLYLTGGVAGRTYMVNLTATTAANRVFQWYVYLPIDPRLAAVPVPPPPSPGYGPVIST